MNVFRKFTLSFTATLLNQCTALPPASSGQLAEKVRIRMISLFSTRNSTKKKSAGSRRIGSVEDEKRIPSFQ